MVEDLVAGIREVLLQVFAELEAGMIRRDMDAHASSLEVTTDVASAKIRHSAANIIPPMDESAGRASEAG